MPAPSAALRGGIPFFEKLPPISASPHDRMVTSRMACQVHAGCHPSHTRWAFPMTAGHVSVRQFRPPFTYVSFSHQLFALLEAKSVRILPVALSSSDERLADDVENTKF